MNRRQFLLRATGVTLAISGALAYGKRPESGLMNSCLPDSASGVPQTAFLNSVWQGLDASLVWDTHAHLVGAGDAAPDTWVSPDMQSLAHPFLHLQKFFYMNAGCVSDVPGQMDISYIERLLSLIAAMPRGFKTVMLAFDWHHDEQGRVDKEHSVFHISNAYAAKIASLHPESFEWAASIHPYRHDAVDAVERAAATGARAVKWLPSAMGIDPASPKCDAFYRAMAKANIPLISHAGREMAVQGGRQDDGNPLKLRRAMDQGVRVIVAHCASDGDDVDLDKGESGPVVRSFDLFARLMDDPNYRLTAHGDISALTQFNRIWALQSVLEHSDWHARLLNGSDYPLPGIMPIFSAGDLAKMGLLDPADVEPLIEIRQKNPLLFDLALKRRVRSGSVQFPSSVFETRRFFTGTV